MTMYNQGAISDLQQKLDYDLWLLEFVADLDNKINGGPASSMVIFSDNEDSVSHSVNLDASSGGSLTSRSIEAMMPLIFVASYKVIDMIFEWILELNYSAGRIAAKKGNRPPSLWTFAEKLAELQKSSIDYPSIMLNHGYILNYVRALYVKLVDFRHEIVHRHHFRVRGGMLAVTVGHSATANSISLDRNSLGLLVRFVVSIAQICLANLVYDVVVEARMKYYLDGISQLHGMAVFGQQRPVLEHVEVRAQMPAGKCTINLKKIRSALIATYSSAAVHFDLRISATTDEGTQITWDIPADNIPQTDEMKLQPDSYSKYRSS